MKNQNNSGLNDKQEKFCREFVVNFNATEAAINAGYSKRTATVQGSQLLTILKVQEFIKSLQTFQAEELEISAKYITENIKNIGERCMQAQPVLDKDGNETGKYEFDANAALKAQELLAKRIGYFKKDNEQLTPKNITHRVIFED